jgi:hypothetical protein
LEITILPLQICWKAVYELQQRRKQRWKWTNLSCRCAWIAVAEVVLSHHYMWTSCFDRHRSLHPKLRSAKLGSNRIFRLLIMGRWNIQVLLVCLFEFFLRACEICFLLVFYMFFSSYRQTLGVWIDFDDVDHKRRDCYKEVLLEVTSVIQCIYG